MSLVLMNQIADQLHRKIQRGRRQASEWGRRVNYSDYLVLGPCNVVTCGASLAGCS